MNRRIAACVAVALAGAALAAEPLIESDTLPADADAVELPRTRSLQPVYPKFPPMAPDAEPPEFAGMVERHNVWRREVGAPELRGWSNEAARLAHAWAQQLAGEGCQMRHSQNPERKQAYGENIYRYWRSSSYEPWKRDPSFIVDAWGSEKDWYDAEDNTCMPPEGGTCGHYTAVVWDRTYLVGCGRAHCGDSEVWVCNYYPRGNYYGMRPFRYIAGGPAAIDLPDPVAAPLPMVPPPAAPVEAVSEPPPVVEPVPVAEPAAPSTDMFGEPPAHDPLLPP